jgi:hypothetical protein
LTASRRRFVPRIRAAATENMHKQALPRASLATALAALSVLPALADALSVDWFKVSAGGGTSTNAVYSVSGTIGQPDAGAPVADGAHSITGGFWSLFQVVQTPGAPTLSIAPLGGGVVVSWPTGAAGWTLQTNSAPTTGAWGNYIGAVTGNKVTLQTATGPLFFRLRK